MNRPVAFDTVRRVVLVFGLVILMSAPGTAAPCWSVIWPAIVPDVDDCAKTVILKILSKAIDKSKALFYLESFI